MQSWFGKNENYAGLHRYFTQQLATLGARKLVNQAVPMLANGLTGGALHPLIRLGHAVHDQNNEEIIAALAYWAWAYQALPYPQGDEEQPMDITAVLSTLLDEKDWPTQRIGRPTITEEFATLVTLPTYSQLRFNATVDSLSWDSLRLLAINALWMHDDFTLLHAVTGVLAAERVTQWLTDKTVLLQPIWKAIVIGWLSKGLRWQTMPSSAGEPTLTLMEIKAIAGHAMRDHTIKLVAACLENYQQTQNALYWRVAEREVMNDAQLKEWVDKTLALRTEQAVGC